MRYTTKCYTSPDFLFPFTELDHCFCEWSVRFGAVIGNSTATTMKLMKRL